MTPSYVRHGATSLAVALLTIPSLIFAQATTGSVRGRVTDAANGRGMAEVQVVVDGTRLGAVTNSNGDYTVNAVPSGLSATILSIFGVIVSPIFAISLACSG